MTEGGRLSVFELHQGWAKLKNEHYRLAAAITQAELGGADLALLRDRQAKLLLDINAIVFEIKRPSLSSTLCGDGYHLVNTSN